jgi:hypothetical protein
MPKDIRLQIKEYMMSTQSKADQQQDLELFLKQISPLIKLKVSWEILQHMFKINPVLKTIYNKQ